MRVDEFIIFMRMTISYVYFILLRKIKDAMFDTYFSFICLIHEEYVVSHFILDLQLFVNSLIVYHFKYISIYNSNY